MRELNILAAAMAAIVMSLLTGTVAAAVTVTAASLSDSCPVLPGQGFANGRLGFVKSVKNLEPCYVSITVSGMPEGGFFEFELIEQVLNNSAFEWHDFHHSLGYGTGDNFTVSGETDEVYISDSAPRTGMNFVVSGQDDPVQPDSLDWLVSGADFPIGLNSNAFRFGLHISDVNEQGEADSDGITTFTLRQQATVPEPGALSLWLLVTGAALLASRRRR